MKKMKKKCCNLFRALVKCVIPLCANKLKLNKCMYFYFKSRCGERKVPPSHWLLKKFPISWMNPRPTFLHSIREYCFRSYNGSHFSKHNINFFLYTYKSTEPVNPKKNWKQNIIYSHSCINYHLKVGVIVIHLVYIYLS